MNVYVLSLFAPGDPLPKAVTYAAGNTPKQAVRSVHEHATLHGVDIPKGRTVWKTEGGLVSCELAKLPEET